jgi:pimeloyl-ACP methyl ester carboxylesterase
MPRKYRILLVLAALAGAFGWRFLHKPPAGTDAAPAAPKPAALADAPATPAPKRTLGALRFAPCSLSAPRSDDTLEAQCTTFDVAENPRQPQGRRIALNIAWLPATEEADVAADPVFFLAGGPGQAAAASYPALDPVFAEVRKHRNVVLVDQRGTGKSNLLACDLPESDDDLAATLKAVDACRAGLEKKADLRFYTTTDAVRDLDAVRVAIGADKIDLVGVSYGTRVAQQYAMRHPAHTRSIVLDSVVPNTLVLGNIFARNLDDALALQFGRCSQDPACKGKLGDPRAELTRLMDTLRRNPPTVQYRDATTGAYAQRTLRPGDVAALVRMYAYMPVASSLLPVLIHDANQGHYDGLAALAQMLSGGLKDAMAIGMQLSVVCSEDGDGIASSTRDDGTLLGHSLTDFMAAQCKTWPRGEVPADFHKPLSTDVPALVLEGEYDPVTPPRYGEEVAKPLPNGRLLVLRGQGHNVIGAGCMPKLFAQFVEKTDAKALDAKCLDALPYAQPFTSYNGWNP